MPSVRRRLGGWLPVIISAGLLAAAIATQASSHTGFSALLHSTHNDRTTGTLTAKNFKFKPARTFKYVVPASAFFPENGDSVTHKGGTTTVTLPAGDEAIAPLQLPIRAQITRLQWFRSQAEDVTLRLQQNGATGFGAFVDMATLGPPCSGADPCKSSTTNINPSRIKGSRHYGLLLDGGTEASVTYKVVITYKLGRPMP